MALKENHRLLPGGRRVAFLVFSVLALVLSACSTPFIDHRPTEGKLRFGIVKLLSQFEKHHPAMVGWNDDVVKIQLANTLPTGRATEAGWLIDWPNPSNQELSQVIVPWQLLGGYPKTYESNSTESNPINYVGGALVSKREFAKISMNTAAQITLSKEGIDPKFAALVNVRRSEIDPSWVIFTVAPYLPVTDIAYGWAKNVNGYWSVKDFGTAAVGCWVTPFQIEKEFGFECPVG